MSSCGNDIEIGACMVVDTSIQYTPWLMHVYVYVYVYMYMYLYGCK